jgi:hypothetical protein
VRLKNGTGLHYLDQLLHHPGRLPAAAQCPPVRPCSSSSKTRFWGAGAGDCTPTASGPCNLNTLRTIATSNQDDPKTLEAKIDGVRMENLRDFRVESPVMLLTLPKDNAMLPAIGLDVPEGTYTPNVSDGYWLMFAPLSRGKHTIRVKGVAANGFTVETTYHLTIAK